MLETLGIIGIIYIILYSFKLTDEVTKKSTNEMESKNQNSNSQSAGNETEKNGLGTSETICAQSENEWLAGVMDGDGNWDVRILNGKRVLKAISIKLSVRDARILYRIQTMLHVGRIVAVGPQLAMYVVSDRVGMTNFLNRVNGEIRLKVPGLKEACTILNIEYKIANPKVPKGSAYLAGLLDTEGSVVINYPGNRIDMAFEFTQNEYTLALDLSEVIEGAKPVVRKFEKRNQTQDKVFYSIRHVYENVGNMQRIYNYFKKNRCYSDFKYYRVMKIKRFLELRPYKSYPKDSVEFKLYNEFLKDFYTHLNEGKPLPSYIVH